MFVLALVLIVMLSQLLPSSLLPSSLLLSSLPPLSQVLLFNLILLSQVSGVESLPLAAAPTNSESPLKKCPGWRGLPLGCHSRLGNTSTPNRLVKVLMEIERLL